MTVTSVLACEVQPEGHHRHRPDDGTPDAAVERAVDSRVSRSRGGGRRRHRRRSSSSSSSSWSCSSAGVGRQIAGAAAAAARPTTATDRYNECQTGADANESADCARALVENSLRGYWGANLEQQTGDPVRGRPRSSRSPRRSPPAAAAAPAPRSARSTARSTSTIYLDSTFFEDVLEGQLGGQGGDFVEPYVLAHEYGHHIQNLLGTMGKVKTQQGPQSDAVRLELQADCYAGMWTKGAMTTDGRQGREDLRRRSTVPTSTRRSTPPRRSATTGSRRPAAGR